MKNLCNALRTIVNCWGSQFFLFVDGFLVREIAGNGSCCVSMKNGFMTTEAPSTALMGSEARYIIYYCSVGGWRCRTWRLSDPKNAAYVVWDFWLFDSRWDRICCSSLFPHQNCFTLEHSYHFLDCEWDISISLLRSNKPDNYSGYTWGIPSGCTSPKLCSYKTEHQIGTCHPVMRDWQGLFMIQNFQVERNGLTKLRPQHVKTSSIFTQ